MKAKLILEDGSCYEGTNFGAKTTVAGEVVFNTGMTGYPEILTDASYKGQILVLTYPLIGNYGVPSETINQTTKMLEYFESDKIHISALVIADYSHNYNHWNAHKSLDAWLQEHNIPAIYGIDTRCIAKKLRDKGVMLGKVLVINNINNKINNKIDGKIDDETEDKEFDDPNKRNLVAEVSCNDIITYCTADKPEKTIVLIDCGVKNNIIRELLKRNLKVIRVPWDYDFFQLNFDGIFLSNGPGDPKKCTTTIRHIRKAMAREIPIFGICLGNQLLALAAGANTYKLRYGHRSQNQPCHEIGTKRCFITSQNHGYAVDEKTLPVGWEPWFVNANDTTNEGIRHISRKWMSVQFHPEATAGPVDTNILFDTFVGMM